MSYLPIRISFAPSDGESGKYDLKVGVRNAILNSATFRKARAKFLEIIEYEKMPLLEKIFSND